jgi:uncharacterized protein YjbI with pentapeptide repeats
LIICSTMSLLFLTGLPFIPVAAPAAASQPSAKIVLAQAKDTPTVADPTVTALEKEQLAQQIDQLKNQNNWYWTSASTFFSTIALLVAGIFGAIRWFSDRRIERDKRAEERFLTVVTGLGGEREETKVGAAIMLRTFLGSGYQQFHSQAFDLAVANLRLRKATTNQSNNDASEPLTPLAQALVTVFKEAFPLARDLLKQDPRYFNASEVQLDRAYLSGADLRTIWMPQAYLRDAILNRVDLTDALLSDTVFVGAELKGAQFTNAQLRRANLSHTTLTGANLSRTKLRGAICIGANFSEADLSGADLPGANLTQTDIEKAKSLNGAKMYNVTGLTQAQQDACVAKGAILNEI